jgi:hypothetical protein
MGSTLEEDARVAACRGWRHVEGGAFEAVSDRAGGDQRTPSGQLP